MGPCTHSADQKLETPGFGWAQLWLLQQLRKWPSRWRSLSLALPTSKSRSAFQVKLNKPSHFSKSIYSALQTTKSSKLFPSQFPLHTEQMFLHVHVRLYSVIPTVTYKARKPHSFGDEGVTSFKTSSKVTSFWQCSQGKYELGWGGDAGSRYLKLD